MQYIPQSSSAYRKLLIGLLVFALFNSSDVFLLLMLKEQGVSDTSLIGIYIFYNLVYALLAFPAGIIADRIGLKKMFLIGLGFFVLVYVGMAFDPPIYGYYILFFLYGAYAAGTEGIAKAWISRLADAKDTATAIGTYEGLRSLSALLASTLAGLLWVYVSPQSTFLATAVATLGVIIYLGTRKSAMTG